MSKRDGGLAFPNKDQYGNGASGMTMRQYYKAAALTGIVSCVEISELDDKQTAVICGQIADAMIAEDEEAAK